MKFDIPFDQLVLFATNLDPGTLIDEAFLRRIRYKIKMDHLREPEYREIFKGVCRGNGIEFRQDVFDFLLDIYRRRGGRLNSCHPPGTRSSRLSTAPITIASPRN